MFFRERRAQEGNRVFPVLPLRDLVVFPQQPTSLIVGRQRSVAALAEAGKGNREVFLVAQKVADKADPGVDDLFMVGTIATIEQTLKIPDGSTRVIVEGRRRARVTRYLDGGEFLEAELEDLRPEGPGPLETQALARTLKSTFERYVKLNRSVPQEMLLQVNALEDPERLADTLIIPLQLKLTERQELLEMADVGQRLELVYRALLNEIEFLQVEKKLKTRVKREREANQREDWLNEQVKAIQKEMGDKEGRTELEELAQQLAAKPMPDPVRDRAQRELRKLSQMNLMSAEATVVRSYLDWVVALPWQERSEKPHTGAALVDYAARVLDEDHHGIRKVKERIVEYLAVSAMVDRIRGPILCLVGPPGVGKTSLGRSMARAMGRPFVRIALGGVRDEAEIRGHRRTYIGAMPGKILHGMKRAGKVDPVVLLDEIDKLSSDFRGDPASALLEVLDGEQNTAFNDHYMDIDYDLSNVTFVCTANSLQGIPLPLQDRLEIIELQSYTPDEKMAIARRYLLPRQLGEHGIAVDQLEVSDQAVRHIIERYTKESGVRDLERQIARICRKAARRILRLGKDAKIKIASTNLENVLGSPRFDIAKRESNDQAGVVNGLAVSPWGGELLSIEAAAVPGKGQLILTGRLGDWLKESANAAFTYIRSRAEALHLDPEFHEKNDVHVNYPGNPLRTDGPSAGIAMAVAMVSALTGIPVRSDTAMTGEISLRGRVLKIGGLKEKVLAAHRGGVKRVLIPEANSRDIADIPKNVRSEMEIIPVTHMDRVLLESLVSVNATGIFGSYVPDSEIEVESLQAYRPRESR